MIQGLDAAKLSSTGQYTFIDALALLASAKPDTPLDSVSRTITQAIGSIKDKKIHLILDSPDALLATGATTSHALSSLLLNLRSQVHSATLTLSSDLPLVTAATGAANGATPLEVESAAFLAQQAHLATLVMAVRELETGAARDVSGVLRVTGGGDKGSDGGEDVQTDAVKEMEALFLVGRDGGVKVFERGAAS